MPATRITRLPVISTSPDGTGLLAVSSDFGGPHTPVGKESVVVREPAGSAWPTRLVASLVKSGSLIHPPPCLRFRLINRFDVRLPAPIGARPITPDAPFESFTGTGTWALAMRNLVVGMVVVNEISNSANTWNGNASEPSALGAPCAPPVAVGNVPRPVIPDSARAEPPPASSRYLATKAGQSIVAPGCLPCGPKLIGTSHGPISNTTSPANSGPQTWIDAPSVKLMLIENRPRSMSIPALIRA